MIHIYAWVVWLAAVLTALSTTRNPLYLTLVILCIAVVGTRGSAASPLGGSARLRLARGHRSPPARSGDSSANATPSPSSERQRAMLPRAPASGPLLLTTVALSALINALSVRTGDTVLFRLPGWLPLLGGPVTFEALVYGGLSGAALAGIVLAFLVAQRHIPTADLVRLIPRAFAPVALVVTVALTFAPSTIRHAQQIREAQLVRGNPFRRLRDWLPLLVPLLVGGLERAFALAEALTARGFAAPAVPDWRPRALLLTGVAVLLLGFGLLAFDQPGGWPLLTGGALAGVGVWLAGRDVPRTRYRQRAWRASDTAVVLTALTALAAYTPLPGLAHTVLLYYPYPALIWPEFDIIIGFMTLGLVWPALARWSAGTSPHKNGASHD